MRIDYMQLEFIHLTLREICKFVEDLTGLEPTITSLFRMNDPGVHGQLPLRGIDLRMRSILVGEQIEDMVNNRFTYDPDRPAMRCAVLHGDGLNQHLHLQVHANTVRNVLS